MRPIEQQRRKPMKSWSVHWTPIDQAKSVSTVASHNDQPEGKIKMRRRTPVSLIFAAVFFLFAARQDVQAKTVNFKKTFSGSGTSTAEAEANSLKFKGTFSGSGPSVPLDTDVDSCTTTGGVTVCTDLSGITSGAGMQSGGIEAGDFTFQIVGETDAVAGTGCLLAPTAIQSCTLGSVTNACEYQYMGGSKATRFSSTGDILASTLTSGTSCIDFSNGTGTTIQLPFDVTGSQTFNLTGGSGKFASATGTSTSNFTGQILSADFQGHAFAWVQGSDEGTVVKP
jgi:hypothetical protein